MVTVSSSDGGAERTKKTQCTGDIGPCEVYFGCDDVVGDMVCVHPACDSCVSVRMDSTPADHEVTPDEIHSLKHRLGFGTFVQGFPAELRDENGINACSNLGMAAVVCFLAERNAETMAIETGKRQQQLLDSEARLVVKIQELVSCDVKHVSKRISDAKDEVSTTKNSLSESTSQLDQLEYDHKKEGQVFHAQLEEGMLRQNQDLSGQANELEVHRLNAVVEAQKVRAVDGMASVVKYLEDKNAETVKAASKTIADLDACYRSEVSMLTGRLSKKISHARALESSTRSSLSTALDELDDHKVVVRMLQAQLEEKTRHNQELIKGDDIRQKDVNALKVDFDMKLRHSQEAGRAKEQEVHDRLNAIIKEKVKAVQDMEALTGQLTSRCWNLKAHLAAVEEYSLIKSAGGSHNDHDHHANVRMLKDACRAADEATDVLVPYLHDLSLASLRIRSPDLYLAMANFFIPGQERHVWGHWICMKIFVGFENVFFGVDDDAGRFTSPLDSKSHASNCFQSFQRKKGLSGKELFEKCHLFRAFCSKKYKDLFPAWLLEQALLPNLPQENIVFDDSEPFNGDGRLWSRFIDFAKAFWMLHEMAFSFDPPASILRVGQGEPYNGQYHENLNDDGTSSAVVQQVLRPAFRVKNTIIRSRVLVFNLRETDNYSIREEYWEDQAVDMIDMPN